MKPVQSLSAKILSYLFGIVVEKRKSQVSGQLEVWFQNGRYVLHSEEANYSFDSLHTVFQKAFDKLKVKELRPATVLVLGFGAGSVASILWDELQLNPEIVGIELDDEVITLAKKYFDIGRFKKMKLLRADAFDFVSTCQQQFDFIVVDIFINKQVPEKFLQKEFLISVTNLLTQQGRVCMNIITETKRQQENVNALFKKLNEEKSDVKRIRISSFNEILSWCK